jgi:hypothetical protein
MRTIGAVSLNTPHVLALLTHLGRKSS